MTPSEFAKDQIARMLEQAGADNVDRQAALRALLDRAAAALAEDTSPEDAKSELTFIANNLGDDEDYAFMRP